MHQLFFMVVLIQKMYLYRLVSRTFNWNRQEIYQLRRRKPFPCTSHRLNKLDSLENGTNG
jgi:hypothetical protein